MGDGIVTDEEMEKSIEVLTKEFAASTLHTVTGAAHRRLTPEADKDIKIEKKDLSKVKKVRKKISLVEENVNDQLEENVDGKWLVKHPWDGKKPVGDMGNTIDESEMYKGPKKWVDKGKVNLKKIYSDLPEFIDQMKGPSSPQDLQTVLNVADKPSYNDDGQKFKAFSLQLTETYLDCEYMLKMHLPDKSLEWFSKENGNRIRKISSEDKKEKRWIFIPSYRRAEIALLEWPEDSIITPDSTIRILVVRPSEFDKYVKFCGHKVPVISLPKDEIGVGYARLWIQKIALRLELDFIWMIDDSVECFYEYHPTVPPPKTPKNKKTEGSDYLKDFYNKNRRRQFGLVFERIEKLVDEAKNDEKPIAAMSPKQWDGGTKLKDPFVCTPPRCVVFLNLKALKSKDIYYRPELQAYEDMIFGYECEQNGLKVFIDHRIHFLDHKWSDTGARSPSVKK